MLQDEESQCTVNTSAEEHKAFFPFTTMFSKASKSGLFVKVLINFSFVSEVRDTEGREKSGHPANTNQKEGICCISVDIHQVSHKAYELPNYIQSIS